jgi:hypothetical protein
MIKKIWIDEKSINIVSDDNMFIFFTEKHHHQGYEIIQNFIKQIEEQVKEEIYDKS